MTFSGLKTVGSPLLLAAALLTLPSCNKKAIAALQEQNADLTRSRDQLQAEKMALQQSKSQNEAALSADLLSKNNQVNQLNQTLGTTEQDLAGKNARVAEMQRILDECRMRCWASTPKTCR
jgi:chemotaxis protein MotB